MKFGIGLPMTAPAGSSSLILEWARRADAGPFSSLSVIDRVVFSNFEPLVLLSAVAAVTQRIRLLTAVLLAPLRNTGMLAKQAASLDVLSGGRLTLGLGVGSREDDFQATSASIRGRGRHFEEQLATMKRIWAGEAADNGVGAVGPAPVQPGGPELLIGGRAPAALRRAARWGNGYIASGDPKAARQNYDVVEQAWKEAGRPGLPRFVGALTCAIGEAAAERTAAGITAYYSFRGAEGAVSASSIPSSPGAITEAIRTYEEAGMDELVLRVGVLDLDQLERLAEVVT